LLRSRAWYDVLARAGHIVTNIELERWFRRRPGQQMLQTFHGYPSKTMGLGLWHTRGLLPSHVEQQLDHTSRTWNALLTPDPEMDAYYRREYAYDGRILALGYPRDDVLVGPDRHDIRTDTRHRLGIAPGQRVVLYAPTWRDDLATNFRAAETTHHLDVEQAAAALGDDYVLLLRGHRFHTSAAPAGSRVLDVTSYPDVNDLMLAADAAVLDYSSMRFDFALTGRPMVFLVPDLDDYGSRTRGFLWDFGETAPGPWVDDTAGVVSELRDLDALSTRWAGPLVAFNARYNSLNDGRAAERVVEAFFADLAD
jgi:CDP-glycerol glycerophosphotransferase